VRDDVKMKLRSFQLQMLFAGVAAILFVFATACSFSRPPAIHPQNKPVRVLKFVPYANDGAVRAYYTLADAETNQVAANGTLRIRLFTTTKITIMQNQTATVPGLTMQNILYDRTFEVGATNFHWETYGTFLRVQDLAMHFIVPYENMTPPVPLGRVATMEIHFMADGATNRIAASRHIVLY